MSPGGLHLRIARVVPAPRERVFDAWTEPAMMRRWFSPVGYETPFAEADPQPGGAWRVGMKPPGEDVMYVSGTYREVERPERLVFTWAWEGQSPSFPGESRVTVEFLARGTETEVVVVHELLLDAASVKAHTDGWEGCLASLQALFRDTA